jgi:DNA replication protein DnaC
MFMLVSRRYECASMIVTSNKPFSGWGEIFGRRGHRRRDDHRLVHHAEILAPKGGSYRLKDPDLARATPTDSRSLRSTRALAQLHSAYGLEFP